MLCITSDIAGVNNSRRLDAHRRITPTLNITIDAVETAILLDLCSSRDLQSYFPVKFLKHLWRVNLSSGGRSVTKSHARDVLVNAEITDFMLEA